VISLDVDGILFDKDGTLFDFHKTWSCWTCEAIDYLCKNNSFKKELVAEALGYDPKKKTFLKSSLLIAGTAEQAADKIVTFLNNINKHEIVEYLLSSAKRVKLFEAVPLERFLKNLNSKGLKIGLVTNDFEAAAHSHLKAAGIHKYFDFVAGYDSGFGIKPDPGPLLAFAEQFSILPHRLAMVGDSTHDLVAAEKAGMYKIGVLTGLASYSDLAPYSDVVFDNIGQIKGLLN
tara:strand:- start:274 stop:969 length:696 start_codon:yes stop_codon:yes gene_type:complete